MNKLKLYLLFLVVVGCTSNQINPLGEEYFIKFYGATGDQEGIAVKATPDGGFILGGNSITEFGGPSDYLLIKVDAQGNQEWLMTYDFEGTGGDDRLQDVLVDGDSYIMAGTSSINEVDKIVLLRVGIEGVEQNRFIIQEANTFDYKCTGISLAPSGNLVVVGSLESQVGISTNGNSIFSVHNNDFSEIRITHSGNQGSEITHVKGFEVLAPSTQEKQYLAVGFTETIDEIKIGFYLFNNLLNTINSGGYKNILSSKAIDLVPIENNNFMILGTSEDLSIMVNLFRENDNFRLNSEGKIIQSNKNVFIGNSLALIKGNEFAISGNIKDLASTKVEASVLTANSITGISNWQRLFGTDFNYTSGQTIVLENGSVLFTGTAGFKGQTKVFLIKLKSNGEMK